jgi:NADPH:quinone reductase-like Zn-dependent oxidoreductase
MRAIVLMGYGYVDQLELKERPDPTAGPGELKVRVVGASINPVDWKTRTGAAKAMLPHDPPIVLGRDAAGVVVAVGDGVRTFRVGDRVMGLVHEAYADFVVAAAEAWAIVPDRLDLVDAAALPLALLTGAQLIEEAVQPQDGDTILITGGVGSVGRAAVFVAKSLGAMVWAGVRGRQKEAAGQLGAHGVVALDDDAELGRLPRLDGIADTIGGDTIKKLFARVKPGGTIGSVLGKPQGAEERGLVVRSVLAHTDSRRLDELARVGEAQRLAEHGAAGKVVLVL